MERETLSNNTEYQKRLREARIKGAFQGRELQQQVSVRSTFVECMCSELFPSLAISSYLLVIY